MMVISLLDGVSRESIPLLVHLNKSQNIFRKLEGKKDKFNHKKVLEIILQKKALMDVAAVEGGAEESLEGIALEGIA